MNNLLLLFPSTLPHSRKLQKPILMEFLFYSISSF